MLPNDPILYGATLPYGDLPIQSPVAPVNWQYPQFTTPWQTLPLQDVTRCMPQNSGFFPYQNYQALQQFPMLHQAPTIAPWMQRPSVTPFPQPFPVAQPFGQPFTQPFAQPFGQPFTQPFAQPFGQPFTQPFAQPFAQPFGQPFGQPSQPFNLNMPICNWQRPFVW